MIDALKLIVARSPMAASQAMQCISAIKAKSPVVQHRYNRCVEAAFSDPNAEFSADERELIAEYVASEGGEDRPQSKFFDVRIRVNATEKAAIQQKAANAGLTVSDFIRGRIF